MRQCDGSRRLMRTPQEDELATGLTCAPSRSSSERHRPSLALHHESNLAEIELGMYQAPCILIPLEHTRTSTPAAMVSLSALRKGKGRAVDVSTPAPATSTSSSRRDPTSLQPINETDKSRAHTASLWPHSGGVLDVVGDDVLDHPDASHMLVVGPREALKWGHDPLAALPGVTSTASAFRAEPAPTIISQRGDRRVAEVPLPYRIDDLARTLHGAGVIETLGVDLCAAVRRRPSTTRRHLNS